MDTFRRSLFRDWTLLKERCVPVLLGARRREGTARVWAVGELLDAVMATVAYADSAPDGSQLSAFVSAPRHPGHFTLNEIRAIPASARADAFRRSDQGWVPSPHIARQITLGEPAGPVDVIALDGGDPPSIDRASRMLKDGGLLLVADPGPEAEEHPHLLELDPQLHVREKLYEKAGTGPAHRPTAPEPGETLDERLQQSDLVSGHLNLARSLARRFSRHGEQRDDLEQVALLALVKAARRYDRTRETAFSTFATASVLGELKRHFRDRTWMMRVPRSIQENYLALKNAREELGHELSRSPNVQEIASRLRITEEAVLEAMEAGESYWPDSLDAGLQGDRVGRDVAIVDEGYEAMIEHNDLHQLLPRLDSRERMILRRIYFDGSTQRQVAEELDVSQMQVSRLLNRTLDKLRAGADSPPDSGEG